MFGSDKKGAAARPAVQVDTLIGARTVIKGDISFSGGLHVDGAVHGALVAEAGSPSLLVLSEKGNIEGEVRAPHVVINEVQITPTQNRGYIANMRQPHVKV